ncbi:MAG: hypothetical protein ACREFQ_06850 [Stellaceae bacterium]
MASRRDPARGKPVLLDGKEIGHAVTWGQARAFVRLHLPQGRRVTSEFEGPDAFYIETDSIR